MRPMSEAPRDGTAILIRNNWYEHGWVIAFWSDPTVGDTDPEESGWYESECSGSRIYGKPLSWKKLPEVPVEMEQELT